MINTTSPIKCLFVDIGGVLLSNGWDYPARLRTAEIFSLEFGEIEDRHHLTFDTYEEGKISLEEYLKRVVFYKNRNFSSDQFQKVMFAQSTPIPQMLDLIRNLKKKYRLQVIDVSNEGRELNSHRIQNFKLTQVIDSFVSSCFVHIRKPDADIFKMALDIAQVSTQQIVYIENTPMFVQIAQGMGIRSLLHTDYESTREALAKMGLTDVEEEYKFHELP